MSKVHNSVSKYYATDYHHIHDIINSKKYILYVVEYICCVNLISVQKSTMCASHYSTSKEVKDSQINMRLNLCAGLPYLHKPNKMNVHLEHCILAI